MERIALRALGVIAGLYLIVYCVVAVARMAYPFELEFLEGTSVTLITRLAAGKPFYVKPSLDFIPSNYTPLYYHLAAALAAVTGTGFLPLRLLSFLSSLGSLTLIGLTVRRETGSWLFGLLSAGLFAASYRLAGAWFDLGRNDSLFLVLLLAGAWIVRFRPGPPWSAAGAAALVALSFFTKQTAAMIAPALVLFTLLTDRRRFAVFTATLALLVGAGILLLNRASDGWFHYYVFRIAGLHAFSWDGFHRFWRQEMLPFFGLALVFTLLLFWSDFREKRHERLLFHLLFVGATFTSSWMIRSHEGAYVNVLMPACAALSMTFGLGLHEALRMARRAPVRPRAATAVVLLLAVAQFLVLAYHPLRLLPGKEDRVAGENLVRQIASLPGEVWLTQHGYLAPLAGKKTYANAITIWDVLADKDQRQPGGLQEEIFRAVAGHRFDAIVFDADPAGQPVSKPGFIDQFYRLDGRFGYGPHPGAFRPITGLASRPELVYMPRRAQD